MKRLALLFTCVSSTALASADPVADSRQLAASALCGATNVTCQQSYTNGSKDTSAAFKRLYSTYKAIRAAEAPPPPPPAPAPVPVPPPPPAPAPSLSGVVSEGDSISVFWGGSHTGLYASSRPDITFKGLAVGGSGLNNLIARRQAVLDLKPKVFTVLIGANDLGGYATGNAYCAAVLSYVGPVRALGAKVAVGTILPQVAPSANLAQGFAAKRTEANACFLGAVGTSIDAVYDSDAVAIPLQADGLHPTDAGQGVMAPVYKAAVNGLLAGMPAPPPAPAPVPPPIDPAIPTTGLPMVADGLDVASLLVKSWGTGAIPPSAAPDVVGAFRLICHASHISYDDPIVFPGQPGKSHLHQWFGNDLADANSTYDSLRKTGNSTCGNALNRSAYWMPALLNGKGGVIRPDYVTIYYKRRPKSDPLCSKIGKACVDLPRGLRFIFGRNMLDMTALPTGGGYLNCDGSLPNGGTVPGAIPGHYPDIPTAAKNCPIGARLGAVISAPECWDGKNLDSADHRSHVAYSKYIGQSYAQCDAAHPYVIPTFTLGAWWSVDADLDRSGTWDGAFNSWHFSSDNMPGMPMKPGTSFHTDWFGAWNDQVLATWHANCLDKMLNASGADLCDGTQLKQPPDSWVAVPHVVPVPPHP